MSVDKAVLDMYKHLQVKRKKEQYDIYDLHLLEMFRKEDDFSMKNQGITNDFSASQYLRDKLGCTDPRVGKYNVLRLSNSALDFERLFVFYDTSKHGYKVDGAKTGAAMRDHRGLILQKGIDEGTKQLKYLQKCFHLLFEKIY